MKHDRTAGKSIGFQAQNLSRILIASYFMAVSLGLVAGTDGTALIHWFIPDPLAGSISAAIIFALALLVMTGIWLRPAALLLALVLFWSSYLTLIGGSARSGVDMFWRDLALIGALFLTYAQSSRRAMRMRSVIRRKLPVRKLSVSGNAMPRRIAQPARPVGTAVPLREVPSQVQFTSRRSTGCAGLEQEAVEAETDNIFASPYPLKASA